MSTKLQFLLST